MTIKQTIFALFLSLACTLSADLFKTTIKMEKDVIYLKAGGNPTIADTISESEQFIFFEENGLKQMYMKSDVEKLGKVTVNKIITGKQLVDRIKIRAAGTLGPFGPIVSRIDYRILVFMVSFFFTMFAVLLFCTLKKRYFKKEKHGTFEKKKARKKTGHASISSKKASPEKSETSDYRSIILFFLEIFKIQAGISKEVQSRFTYVDDFLKGRGKTFELHIKTESDWINRRMSIAPMDIGSGAKSKCFYVIYDSRMVVKIPPSPITNIKSYIRTVRKEGKIAHELAPVECIVPMVSVILDKIHKLPFAKDLSLTQKEKRYIRLLEENDRFHQYLKIGDRFAFFMELSNSFFLGRVISELHELKESAGDEMAKRPNVAWDQQEFSARYGLDALSIYVKLQVLYTLFETNVWEIAKNENLFSSVHKYQIRSWFLSTVTGGRPKPKEGEFNRTFIDRLKKLSETVISSDKKTIETLNQLLKNKQKTELFLQNKRQVEHIVSHMMDLLWKLKEKGIALRDLKPDNLFLSGDPDKYPVFLNEMASFSIGVIDVETAVTLIKAPDNKMVQPILGGTPLYATPLHIMPNKALSILSEDISILFHLQDWHAVIAIIHKTVTGKNLFPNAAGTFPAMLKQIRSSGRDLTPGRNDIKKISALFWKNAVSDFKKNMAENAYLLKQIKVLVPIHISVTLLMELDREYSVIKRGIGNYVKTTPHLNTDKNRDFLRKASGKSILRLIAKWESRSDLPQGHDIAPEMVTFLRNLYRLKQGEKEVLSAIKGLKKPQPQIRVYPLLEAMFHITFNAMYKKRWKTLQPDAITKETAPIPEDVSIVTTVLSNP